MPIPPERHRSYLARQVGTLALSHVQADGRATIRAVIWHNLLGRMGLWLPWFVVHDLGSMFTLPQGAGGFVLGPRTEVLLRINVPQAVRPQLSRYAQLLAEVTASDVVARAQALRLRDDLVALCISRAYGDAYQTWAHRGKTAGVEDLPLEPALYLDTDTALHFQGFDPQPLWSFLNHLASQAWHILSCIEQIDSETLRLLGLFRGSGARAEAEAAFDLADLCQVMRSPEANDVVGFSLDLLPSILETQSAKGVQAFSVDGYASLERRGNPSALVLTELAYDEELFERKILDDELYYYGHERPREDKRRLQIVLVDASASMRGQRQVFARALTLALAKKLALMGDEVWLQFFDSRLHEIVKVTRQGSFPIPYFLTFRSERGRNTLRVFRQLVLELGRLKRDGDRNLVLHIITHGQCHIPSELAHQLKASAQVHGIIVLPSSEVSPEMTASFDRHQIVTPSSLESRTRRKGRALDIIDWASGRSNRIS